jgi:hypothetical protein
MNEDVLTATHRPDGSGWSVVMGGVAVHVLPRHQLTLTDLSVVLHHGSCLAGDRWCRVCAKRTIHDWLPVDGTIRCVCSKCVTHAPEDR